MRSTRWSSRWALLAVGLACFLVLAGAPKRVSFSVAAGQGPVTLPDLKIFVPTDLISIGFDPSSGAKQLRFTHITADVGTGPFEIDPSYSPTTGTATFIQAVYRSPSAGRWVFDHSVPIAAVGAFHPPSDYEFPLTRFTLNQRRPDGSPGAIVATSPKTDYCMTGDTQVPGVANTPDQTYIPQSDCTDPTAPLGWSVGWGDEYDQTDAGQPIDLDGVPDGTYVLHAEVDPRHVFIESNAANDVTDTTLRISGDQVTVLSQSNPVTKPPQAALTSPGAGSSVSGTVNLRASAGAYPPATIRSVQFLLDGEPLGNAVPRPPYTYSWGVGATAPGRHYLSVQATDSDGTIATARPVPVLVVRPSPVKVSAVSWRAGLLTLRVQGVPNGMQVAADLVFAKRPSLHETLHHGRLTVRTERPRLIVLYLLAGRKQVGAPITISLDARPSITITNPMANETVSGIVPIASDVQDQLGVSSVQFFLDGRRMGKGITGPPYALYWDTRRSTPGRHVILARASNVAGNSASARVVVDVQNPAPAMTCFVMQAKVSAHGRGVITTPAFHTAMAGETMLAFVGGDGPAGARHQAAVVSGGGLRWRLVKRANSSSGDSEIWTATAPRILDAQITATLSNPNFDGSVTVVAMEGADGVGAAAAASGPSGAPAVKLRTLSATSLVFAVGNDWDRAVPRELPSGWVFLNQWLDQATGDSYWSQYTNQPTGRSGSVVDVRDLSPTNDQWNLAAVELINDG